MLKRIILFLSIFALAVVQMPIAGAAPPITVSNSFAMVEDFESLPIGRFDGGEHFKNPGSEYINVELTDSGNVLDFSSDSVSTIIYTVNQNINLGKQMYFSADVCIDAGSNAGYITFGVKFGKKTLIILNVNKTHIYFPDCSVSGDYTKPTKIGFYLNAESGKMMFYMNNKKVGESDAFHTLNNGRFADVTALDSVLMEIQQNQISFYVDNIQIFSNPFLGSDLCITDASLVKVIDGKEWPSKDVTSGTYKVKFNVLNYSNAVKNFDLILAQYDGGNLTKAKIAPYSINANDEISIEIEAEVDCTSDANYIRVFLFEDDTLKPLLDSRKFAKDEHSIAVGGEYYHDLLTQNHPMLCINASSLANIKSNIKNDVFAGDWYAAVAQSAANTSVPYIKTSRGSKVEEYLEEIAFVYLADGNTEYAQKVADYLQTAVEADLLSGGTSLDIAEMFIGMALAYDWCYDYLIMHEPRLVDEVENLFEDFLELSLNYYKKQPMIYLTTKHDNMNSVLNSGHIVTALALLSIEEYSDLCGEVLQYAFNSLQYTLESFAPDGGWLEGPGYHGFMLKYLTIALKAIETSTGNSYGITDYDGVPYTAKFMVDIMGENSAFNYGDSGEVPGTSSEYLYFADKFNQPDVGGYRVWQLTPAASGGGGYGPYAYVWDLIYYNPGRTTTDFAKLAKGLEECSAYKGAEVASLKSNVLTDNINFVAMKASSTGFVGHGQLDAGTFVYETGGERWIMDMGIEHEIYSHSNIWNTGDTGTSRWSYYCNRAEGHNTFSVNSNAYADQNINVGGTIEDFYTDENYGYIVADIAPAYTNLKSDDGEVNSAYFAKADRGLLMNKSTGALLVKDEIEFLPGEYDFYSFYHTRAAIDVANDGKSAVLTQNGKYLKAVIVGDGTFETHRIELINTDNDPFKWESNAGVITSASYLTTQEKYDKMQKLMIHIPKASGNKNICIYMQQVDSPDEEVIVPEISSIQNWRNLYEKGGNTN